MIKYIVVLVVAWLVGVFGWAQIVGSIQNLKVRKMRIFTMIVWILIMGVGAYFAIVTFDSLWALIIGYLISFIQVIRSGRIQ